MAMERKRGKRRKKKEEREEEGEKKGIIGRGRGNRLSTC